MLRSVDTNTGHTKIDKVVEITSHCIANVVQSSVQVRQTNQVAVSDVIGVSIVVDITCSRLK